MVSSTITHHFVNDVTVLIDPGTTLDNNNAHEMLEVITTSQAKGCKYVIIDMARLEFLSSAGVGSILGTVESFREQRGDIILCNLPAPIKYILQVLDLADFLTIRPNREDALAACSMNK
jgi:anti-anti-sigma factor